MFHFTIQAAKHCDANAVCRIAKRVLLSEITPDKMKKLYVEIIENVDQIIMIAVNSGKTVGFIHARRVEDLVFGCYTEIVTIALLPYYQRRGGGTSLLLGAEQWSRQMLTPNLKCTLKGDNMAVKALLHGCGYVENGQGAFEKTIV